MMSNFSSQSNKNYEHNVFRGINIRPNQEELFCQFIDMLDVSPHTIQALIMDIRKFAKWFTAANAEPWDNGKNDIFVHYSDIIEEGQIFNEGQRVVFDIGENDIGPCATNVVADQTSNMF